MYVPRGLSSTRCSVPAKYTQRHTIRLNAVTGLDLDFVPLYSRTTIGYSVHICTVLYIGRRSQRIAKFQACVE